MAQENLQRLGIASEYAADDGVRRDLKSLIAWLYRGAFMFQFSSRTHIREEFISPQSQANHFDKARNTHDPISRGRKVGSYLKRHPGQVADVKQKERGPKRASAPHINS